MDCYSNFSDYRHHPIAGNIGSPGLPGLSNNFFGHGYSSAKHQHSQHSSLYRLTGTPNYGPVSPAPLPLHPPSLNLYSSYDRYGSYPTLPSYGFNGNGFGYGGMNMRDMSGYYSHYDSYHSRLGTIPYHQHREQYGPTMYGHRGSGSAYHSYPYSLSNRDYYQNSSSNYQLHAIGQNQNQPFNRDIYTPRPPDMLVSPNIADVEPRDDVHNSKIYHSETASSQLTSINGNTSSVDSVHREYLPHADTTYLIENPNYSGSTGDQHHYHTPYQLASSSGDVQQRPTYSSSQAAKETKLRKMLREKEKISSRLAAHRKQECCSPSVDDYMEKTETLSRNVSNSSANIPPRLQNGFLSSNQPLCQPFSKLIRKRHHILRSQSSPMPQSFVHKNRVLECDLIPCKRSKKKVEADVDDGSLDFREEIKNITPLPGFQQAFGSTEIGKFSETFFNTPDDSPYEIPYESEADTLSPQPWEAGDSLEGPHFNLHIGATVQPVYSDNHSSTDSPIDTNYFSEIRCSDY